MIAFIDTFAMIALLNPRDRAHAAVASYLKGFNGRLVTTEWVLMELADALSAPVARTTVVAFLQSVRTDPLFEIVDYSPRTYQNGLDLFSSRQDKSWSLTDCISFAVMTQRKITNALTADRHFEQAGFVAFFK